MASKAKKIRKNGRFVVCPKKKKSKKPTCEETKNLVRGFYLYDDNSRVQPRSNDCVSIRTENGKERVQKRLLLKNLRDLHVAFRKKYPMSR